MENPVQRRFMRGITGVLSIAIAGAVILQFRTEHTLLHAATSLSASLTGQVSSEEGPMEGVLVSAKRDGSTITVTVDSDGQGRYSFPRNRLDPGQYSLRVRAIGYELDGPTSAQIAAGKTATVNLKLRKKQDISSQLTNTEWLLSMPGRDEEKFLMGVCGNCHTYERILKSHYTADEFLGILRLMGSFSPGSTPAFPQARGLDGGVGVAVRKETAQFLSTINLSAADKWAFPLKTLPRPTGRATHVIVTEYDLPRPEAEPHDVLLDSDGLVWYRDFGTEHIGSLDPKTGKVVDYPMPEIKPGFSRGMADVEIDRFGNLWTGIRQAAVIKFDTKTHEFTFCCANQDAAQKDPKNRTDFGMLAPVYGADGKVKVWGFGPNMPGVNRLDLSTGQLQNFYSHAVYGVNADSKGNGYGLEFANQNIIKVDATSGEVKVYRTPTPNSGPRRGRMDSQDRYWFAEFRGNKIGVFDTRTEMFKEWALPTPWTGPYDVVLDKNGEAWTGGMFSDRVIRFNTKTGQFTEYLLPRNTNIRRVFVDNSTTPVTFWAGNNHGRSIVKVEPLE